MNPTSGTTINAVFGNDNAFKFSAPSSEIGYRYVITEQPTSAHGVDYDPTQYLLVVRVDDNGNGTLEVSSTELYTIGDAGALTEVEGNTITFNNTYSATETTIPLEGTKTIDGRAMTEDDTFQFQVSLDGSRALDSQDEFAADATQPQPENSTVTASPSGTIQFTGLTFNVDCIGKEYKYTVTEVLPAGVEDQDPNTDGFQYNGLTYDQTSQEVIVKVDTVPVNDGDAIRARVFVDGAEVTGATPAFAFTNVYNASETLDGSTYLKVAKTLTGRAWGENETFTFQLEGLNGAPMPEGATGPTATITVNAENPTSAFDSIVYDQDDLDQNGRARFTYVITELGADGNGLHMSDASYTVTVDVVDNGNGKLTVTPVMTQTAADDGTAIDPATTVDGNTAAFTNTYTSTFEGTPVSLDGTKVLTNPKWPTGVTLDANDFWFHVESLDGAPVIGDNQARNVSNDNGTAADDKGTFNGNIANLLMQVEIDQSLMVDGDGNPVASKDFQYIITELDQSTAGYDYDATQYRVTVTAADDQQGSITASVSKVEKRANEEADWEEVWTTASDTDVNDAIVFNNSYEPSDETLTSADLGLTKELTGNRSTTLAENEFTFTMSVTADDGSDINSVKLPNTLTAGNTANDAAEDGVYVGGISFGDITFTKAGTFTIHVKENAPDNAEIDEENGTWTLNGVTGSTAEHTFTYNVVDRGGNLVATLDRTQSTGGNVFTNTYAATGSQDLTGSKNITGRDFEEGDSFTFQVEGEAVALDGATQIDAPKPSGVSDDNWQLTINPTSGSTAEVALGTVTFTQPGDYTYTFYEYEGDLPGMTYADDHREVVFHVTDNGDGKLNVEVTQGNLATAVTWTNEYFPTTGDSYATTNLNGTKTFTGRDMLADEHFDFVIEGATDDTDATTQGKSTADLMTDGFITIDQNTASVSGLKNAQGSDTDSFNFGNITFTPNAEKGFDGTGTFTFNVSEVLPQGVDEQNKTADGITYDTHVGTLAVTVTDLDENGKHTGKLTATAQFAEGTFAFKNSYNAEPATFSVDDHWDFQKVIDGRDWLDTDSFRFLIAASGDTPLPETGVESTDPRGRIITLENQGGTADGSPVSFDFGTVSFDFDDMKTGATVAPGGSRSKTFTYNISELNTAPGIAGMSNSGARYQVTLTVTDDNTGTLEVTDFSMVQLADQAGDAINPATPVTGTAQFVNTYRADVDTYGFRVIKVYNDTTKPGNQLQDGMFTFQLKPTGANAANAPMPDGTTGTGADRVYERTNVGNTAIWPDIEFTQADDGETYTYEISEVNAGTPGMKYDSTVYKATVVVTTDTTTDPAKAQVNADVTIENLPESGLMTFTNTYEPTSGTLEDENALHGTKTVDGRNILTGEVFNYTLAPADETTQQAITDGLITIKDDWANSTASASTPEGDGTAATANFAFDDMTFTHVTATDAPYKFIITEDLADGMSEDNPVKDGLTYDRHQTVVTVTVTDNGQGALVAEATYDNSTGVTDADKQATDQAAFTNVYRASGTIGEDAEGQLGVTKKVSGTEFTADMKFNFTLKLTGMNNGAALDGVQVEGVDGQMVALTDDGIVRTIAGGDGVDENGQKSTGFGKMMFTKTGDYTFTVSENEADDNVPEHWTYDNSDKTITVHVTDPNQDGKLQVEVDPYGTTFTNTYFDESTAKSGSVETTTGDHLDSAVEASAGDIITYTINWANNSVSENGEAQSADVVVSDKVPAGTTLVDDSIMLNGQPAGDDVVSVENGEITWTIADQEPGATGTVSFKVQVNEDATGTTVSNTAWFNNEPDVTTNTVKTEIGSGNLIISKTVELDAESQDATEIDTDKEFTFTVNLSKNNAALTGEYQFTGTSDGVNTYEGKVGDGDTITLKHSGSVTINGLPEGATWTVTEDVPEGYTANGNAVADEPSKSQMTGTITEDGQTAAFVNTYSVDPGTVEEGTDSAFSLTKQFTGRDGNAWLDADKFSFTLTVINDGAPMPADNDGIEGSETVTVDATDVTDVENGIAPIDFGSIEYSKTGTYTYTVQEANADGELGTGGYAGGITYDGRTVNITVTVTDNGTGGLVAAVAKTGEAVPATDDAAAVSFRNTYDSSVTYNAEGVGGLDVTKVLNNRDMTAGQFTFTVTAKGDAADKIGDKPVQMTSNAANAGEVKSVANNPFDNISFDRDDSGKDFVYTIVEDQKDGNGYICDSSTYTVAITPTDMGDGTMSVTTVVTDSDGEYNMKVENATATDEGRKVVTVPFENTYDAGDVTVGAKGDASIVAKKVLENDDIALYDGKFTFKVTGKVGADDVTVATGKNNADGSITFDTITYTSENLYAAAHGGSSEVGTASLDDSGAVDAYTFNYTVSEDPVTIDGVTNKDGNDSSVTVTVTDDRAGKLSIQVEHKPNANGLVFTNTYGAGETAVVTISGNKNLTGINGAQAPSLTDDMFEFTITGSDGAPMPETVTVGNAGTGISFGPITYKMEEVFGNQAAQADAAEADAAEQTDEAVETEGAELEGEATEVETTDEAATESETTDEIAAGESAPAENEGIELYTAGRTKTFTYTISETHAGDTINGITYDRASKTVEVTVTDEGEGKISAAVTKVADGADNNMDFTFNNTYSVTPEESSPTEGEGALTFTKVWDRQGGTRELAAGDFTFQLKAGDEVVSTGTNDADGNVEMSAIKFTQAGEYSYELREVVPEGATPVDGGYEKDGVLYLNTSYTVTAKVTDNHNGTLSVAWSMTDANGDDVTTATFVNTYFVSDTSVTFGAAKALEGRAVKDGEFTFELSDAKGNVLGTATNDETGQIVFADAVQSFGSVGEYDFVIAEVLPEDDDAATEGIQKDGVTYDETAYTAHVVVSDDNKGKLVVTELTYNGEAALPVFHNTYTEPAEPPAPEEPKPEEPKPEVIPATGDAAAAAVMATAGIGAALAAAGYVTSKKRGE